MLHKQAVVLMRIVQNYIELYCAATHYINTLQHNATIFDANLDSFNEVLKNYKKTFNLSPNVL